MTKIHVTCDTYKRCKKAYADMNTYRSFFKFEHFYVLIFMRIELFKCFFNTFLQFLRNFTMSRCLSLLLFKMPVDLIVFILTI